MFFFLSLLLQCKFANSTLLSLLSFSYFITPYDAQASSAFSALILPGKQTTEQYVSFVKMVKKIDSFMKCICYIVKLQVKLLLYCIEIQE